MAVERLRRRTEKARTSGKLVFVDFTGYTCTNCRWMEANIFNRPDVGAELDQFILSRLYTDGEGEMYERQQAFQEQTFGTVALPLYAVVRRRRKSTLDVHRSHSRPGGIHRISSARPHLTAEDCELTATPNCGPIEKCGLIGD